MAKRLYAKENNQFTFVWKIENFNYCQSVINLKSPQFSIGTSNPLSWHLEIISRNSYLIYIAKKGAVADVKTGILCKVQVIDGNGKFLFSSDFNSVDNFKRSVENYGDDFYVDYYDDYYEDYYDEILSDLKITNERTITIRCMIVLPEAITDNIYECLARTKIMDEPFFCIWNVENFIAEGLDSKTITCSQGTKIKITLSKSDDNFMNITVKILRIRLSVCFILCKIALLKPYNKKVQGDTFFSHQKYSISRKIERALLLDNGFILEIPSFIEINELCEKGKYIRYNSFPLMCEFSVSTGNIIEEIEYHHRDNQGDLDPNLHAGFQGSSSADSVTNLQENFQRMYADHLQSDLEIQCGTETLKAHKCVLSAWSPVFAVMFDKDMLKNRTGVVDIPDIETDILDSFLRFMYCGTIDKMNYDSASKLLIAADKYQVPVLKEICSAFLMSNLNDENVCNILCLADQISHKTLKNSAADHIVKHANAILPTEAWSRLIQTNIKLATDVMYKLSKFYVSNSYP